MPIWLYQIRPFMRDLTALRVLIETVSMIGLLSNQTADPSHVCIITMELTMQSAARSRRSVFSTALRLV